MPDDPVVPDEDPPALDVPLPLTEGGADEPDTAGVADWLGAEAPGPAAGADCAPPPGTVVDGAFTLGTLGAATCGTLGGEGAGSGGTVTDGVVTPPAGVGTVTGGTVPRGTITAPLEPGSAVRLEASSPTTSTGSTATFRDMAS